MPCCSLICQGSSKGTCTIQASSWWLFTSGILARSGHQSGVSCAHACQVTHLSYSSTRGSGKDLVPSSSSELPASSQMKWLTFGPNSGSGSRSKSRRGGLAPLSSQILDPTREGYAQRRGQGSPPANPVASFASSSGYSPLAVMAPRVGMGVQPASSDGLAQPLYLTL